MSDLKPAAGYIRVASKSQTSALNSVEQQRRDIERDAGRHGFEVIGWYLDVASGSIAGRQPDLQCLIDDSCSKARPFHAVFIATSSRVSRDPARYEACRLRLQRYGIQLFSADRSERTRTGCPP